MTPISSSSTRHQNEITSASPFEEEKFPLSRGRKWIRFSIWTFVTFFFLILFTLAKLPSERLRNWLEGNLSIALAQKGISYTAVKKSLTFFPGATYQAKDVSIHFPPPSAPAHLDEISLSPAIFPLVFGRYGGQAEIRNKDGELKFAASLKNPNQGFNGSITFNSKKLDLGKTGILPGLLGIQVSSALLDGSGKVEGDFNIPNTLNGKLWIRLNPLILDAQTILGFNTPKISISDGLIELNLEKGKAIIKNFKFGKSGNASDDLLGVITGDVSLNKTWESSQVNLKVNFTLSENIKKAFILLDTLLAEYKQADGSYTLQLTGSLMAPLPSPAAPAAPK